MFLSIVIPVYNAKNYLKECLDSILQQNIDSDEYEIVCVNDGSTDSSDIILNQYEQILSNIEVLTQSNKGISAARNAGLNYAKGDYVWFVDSDDIVMHDIFGELKKTAESSDADRILFGCYTFQSALNEKERVMFEEFRLPINHYTGDVYVWNSIFKRSFLREHELYFDESAVASEDGLFVLEFNSYSHKSVKIEKAFYLYRRHNNSICTNNSGAMIDKKLQSYIHVTKKAEKLYKDDKNGINHKEIADFLMNNLWSALFVVSQMTRSERKLQIQTMARLGLYPYKRVKECTLRKSYMTLRTDLYGKFFDWIYIHLHTRYGYNMMIWLQYLRRLKRES